MHVTRLGSCRPAARAFRRAAAGAALVLVAVTMCLAQQSSYPHMSSAPASREITPDVRQAIACLKTGGWDARAAAVVVDVRMQRLLPFRKGVCAKAWQVSTSKNGVGSEPRSYKTPAGLHRIWKKSGEKAQIGQPLRGGEPSDAPVSEESGRRPVYISTRAMMLDGLEDSNRESKSRGIWIHGTTAEERIGRPASIGCIRMRAVDAVELFNAVQVGTLVYIAPPSAETASTPAPSANSSR